MDGEIWSDSQSWSTRPGTESPILPLSYIKLINLQITSGSRLCVIKVKLDQIAEERDRYQLREIEIVMQTDRSTTLICLMEVFGVGMRIMRS